MKVAVPWSLPHYVYFNGFHPLYQYLFEYVPDGIEFFSWDNKKLNTLRSMPTTLLRNYLSIIRSKARAAMLGRWAGRYFDHFGVENFELTRLLPGDIELLHTVSTPSFTRPFVYHLESFLPMLIPFSRQGGAEFDVKPEVKKFYRNMLASPQCLGIFSHIQGTLDQIEDYFDCEDIANKLHYMPIGVGLPLDETALREKLSGFVGGNFLIVNSAHQCPENIFNRGGHLILSNWDKILDINPRAVLKIRSMMLDRSRLSDMGVNLSLFDRELGKSIIWMEDHLSSEEIQQLYYWADFFVLPSLNLHASSILNAFNNGCIPILTDTLGVEEFASHNDAVLLKGVAGAIWFYDPVNKVFIDKHAWELIDLADVKHQLIDRLRQILTADIARIEILGPSVQRLREKFSGKKQSARFWEVVEQLLLEYRANNVEHVDAFRPLKMGELKVKSEMMSYESIMNSFNGPTMPMLIKQQGDTCFYKLGKDLVSIEGDHDPHAPLIWGGKARDFGLGRPRLNYA